MLHPGQPCESPAFQQRPAGVQDAAKLIKTNTGFLNYTRFWQNKYNSGTGRA